MKALRRLVRRCRYWLPRRRMDRMSQPLVNAMFRQIVGRWRYEQRRCGCWDCREATLSNGLSRHEGDD